jgi:hypothetical protein
MAAAGRIRFYEYFTQEADPYSDAGNFIHHFRADRHLPYSINSNLVYPTKPFHNYTKNALLQ